MKRQQASQTRKSAKSSSNIRARADNPILALQSKAGNRAVARMIELQRKGGEPDKPESKASAAAQAMYDSTVMEPITNAIAFARSKKRWSAIGELEKARKGVFVLVKTAYSSGPRFDAYMALADSLQDYKNQIKPPPIDKTADEMEIALIGEANRVKVHTLV